MPLVIPNTDALIQTSDITTNNASTSKHGFRAKLTNVAYSFMDETGTVRASVPYILSSGGLASATTNDTAEHNLFVVTIGAGVIGTNGRIFVEPLWKCVGINSTKTAVIRLSTTSGDTSAGYAFYNTVLGAATTLSAKNIPSFWNVNSASVQIGLDASVGNGIGNGTNTTSAGAINTANTSYINFNAKVANAADTIGLVGYTVWLIPGV